MIPNITMPNKTNIENEFELDIDDKNLDMGKVIAISIKVEKRQALFYSGMEGVLHNHDIIHFFKFLFREKKLQQEILENAKKDLENGEDWPDLEYDYTDVEEAIGKGIYKLREKELRKDAGDLDVLERAVSAEETTTTFYERLADNLRGKGNDFFRTLSEREQRHHDLLVSILDAVKSSGNVR
jgi:rubrerythrin